MTLKLQKYLRLTAKLELLTGLRIGGTADKVEIGGLDNPVIKDKDGRPYIPGSSLKGKMRTLLEYDLGKVGEKDAGIHSCHDKNCVICRLFGCGKTEDNEAVRNGPSRIIVRDARPSEDWKNKLPYEMTEVKTEVTISRITGTAGGGGPRQMERVPAGVTFDVEILCRVFDQSDEDMFKNYIYRAIKLLEMDCLGGSGSRGYGKVEFKNVNIVEEIPSPK